IDIIENLSLKKGDIANDSSVNMSVHTGTHIDAPSHFISDGNSVDKIEITTFMGPAYVCHMLNIETITADILDSCQIPKNAKRLLLRTNNSTLWAQKKSDFYKDYVALSPNAAKWIVENNIELVGIDYLSIQKFDDPPDVHITLLKNNVVILEGINLSDVSQGWYDLICLPLKLENIEGSPARALLQQI
ncbi:MAG: cyclase family protein, partial [Nitrosopumilaceae archaeon]|nr:cyclase family protein [Nitrosopumilaceae archaeon]